jgi:hypothetical protein
MKYLGKSKYDSVLLGTLLGLFTPVILFMGYYLIRYRGMYFPAYIRYLNAGENFLPILSLCVTPNLLTFFIFIWTKRDKSAKGVLAATIVYASFVCIMKMIYS